MSALNNKFNNQQQMNRNNPIDELIREIKNANTLKDVFTPEKYALPGGWADSIASIIIIEDSKKKQENNKKKASMNSNQLRKIFTQLKNIEKKLDEKQKLDENLTNEILLLMPQIAYTRGRELISESFYNLLKECISSNKIMDKEDFKRFVKFYEAVIAYSKMYNK